MFVYEVNGVDIIRCYKLDFDENAYFFRGLYKP